MTRLLEDILAEAREFRPVVRPSSTRASKPI